MFETLGKHNNDNKHKDKPNKRIGTIGSDSGIQP